MSATISIIIGFLLLSIFFVGAAFSYLFVLSPEEITLAEDYVNCYWAFTCTDDPQYCSYEAEMTLTEIEYYQWECRTARNYKEHYKILEEASE